MRYATGGVYHGRSCATVLTVLSDNKADQPVCTNASNVNLDHIFCSDSPITNVNISVDV